MTSQTFLLAEEFSSKFGSDMSRRRFMASVTYVKWRATLKALPLNRDSGGL